MANIALHKKIYILYCTPLLQRKINRAPTYTIPIGKELFCCPSNYIENKINLYIKQGIGVLQESMYI